MAELPETYLTTEEAARILRTSDQGVRRLIRLGRLRAGRPGRRYLIDPEDITRLMTPPTVRAGEDERP